jgi:hypothetical protein
LSTALAAKPSNQFVTDACAELSLQRGNEKALLRMRRCVGRSSHFYRVKFIPSFSAISKQSFCRFRQWRRGLSKTETEGFIMLNKLFAAAAVATIAYAVVPANAARMHAGCSSENLSKTETSIEAMADGEGKVMAQKEIALAQDAMLSGKMGACGMHLSKAMHAGMVK